MPLLEPIRAVPLSILSYGCPLLIIGCFLVSFGQWLRAKTRTAVAIYSLSIFTHALIRATATSAEQAALIGGIFAPTVYGLGFVCLGAVRSLSVPYGCRIAPVKPKHRSRMQQLVASASGGCVGSGTGVSVGAVAGLILFLIAPLLAPGLGWPQQSLPRILVWSMALFGTLGGGLGALVGWGAINLKQLGDRVLIYVTIQGFLLRSACSRLLKRIWRR